jgi:hypothetical protein
MLRRNTIKPGPRLTPLDAPRRQSIRGAVILAHTSPVMAALRQATRTIR